MLLHVASLPSWERGLKSFYYQTYDGTVDVAPLVGAWIEIDTAASLVWGNVVAPLVGAWIEMLQHNHNAPGTHVAPLVGAWIEIPCWM